jgi:hypothetical protein
MMTIRPRRFPAPSLVANWSAIADRERAAIPNTEVRHLLAAPATISNASSGILKKRISSSVSSSPIEVFFIVLNPVIFAVTEIGRAATCKHHDPMLNLRRGCQNNAITGDANCPKGHA